MSFEQRIMELCEQLIASRSDAEAIELGRRLRELLHQRLEELRVSNAVTLPALDRREVSKSLPVRKVIPRPGSTN